jgi:hypothetical protein
MNPISDIKRFVLRSLFRLSGVPWPDPLLDDAARQGVFPRPLQSDINQSKRELESAGYIQGFGDEFDDQLTWTLTEKGRHKARQLG